MSVYTTKDITKENAMIQIKLALEWTIHNLKNFSDEELQGLMFEFYGDENLPNTRLENYRIIS